MVIDRKMEVFLNSQSLALNISEPMPGESRTYLHHNHREEAAMSEEPEGDKISRQESEDWGDAEGSFVGPQATNLPPRSIFAENQK